jgi:hypothetical protein
MNKLIALLILSFSGFLVVTTTYAGFFDGSHDGFWGHEGRGGHEHHFSAPEIDPSSAVTALTLLLGGVSVLRSRIGKK